MRRSFLILGCSLVGLAVLAPLFAPHSVLSQEKPKGGWIKLGALVDIDNLDPAIALRGNTRRVLFLIFDTLVRTKPNDPNYYPGLATSWQVSPDAKSITFELRRGVKFHDGTPFNAEAVKFTLDRIGLKGGPDRRVAAGTAVGALGPYEGADVLGEYTVRVRWIEPYAPALTMLALEVFGIVSPTAAKKWGLEFTNNPVGTGPFTFKEWVKNDHLTVVRNPDYKWGPPIFKNQGPPHIEGIVWKIIPEDGTRVGTLESGEMDIIEEVPVEYYSRLKQNLNIKVASATIPGTPVYIIVNVSKEPTDQLAVREGLRYAVNQDLIVKTLYKDAFSPARSVLDPATFAYSNLERYFTYDLAKARETLDRGGWTVGPDGIRVKDGKRLKLRFLVGPAFDVERVAPLLQAAWREVGIEVDIEKLVSAPYFAAVRRGDHHLAQQGWWYPDPHVMYSAFHSKFAGTGFNFTHSKIPALDQMLEEGYKTADPKKRIGIYRSAQELWAEMALGIPIRRMVLIYALKKNIHDLEFSHVAWPLFNDVYISK